MKRITLLGAVLAISACSLGGITLDPNRSTQGIAPDYLQLTPDEENIWVTMTDAQRERAILFITSGSTLISSLGDE